MKREPMFPVGCDVFVRDPKRFVDNCTCIVGPVIEISQIDETFHYRIAGSVGRVGGGYEAEFVFAERDIGERGGTPLSQLSGRPGFPGYDHFAGVATSWGYP